MSTKALLERSWSGDSAAVEALIQQNHDWLWRYVRRRMGQDLRRFETSEDVVQDVLRKLIQRGPRFVPRNEEDFRRLVATIVINRLTDRHDWVHAARRDRRQEEQADARDWTHVGFAAPSKDAPSRVVAREEEQALLDLAMELMDPEDAYLIRLRNWEDLSWKDVGARLAIDANTARMRFSRAVVRLGEMTRRISTGDVSHLAPDASP